MLNNATDFRSPVLSGKIVIGTVTSNNDPLRLGRFKARVDYLHPTSIADEDLPWIIKFSGFGNTGNIGNTNPPAVGSKVAIFYPTDDLYSGIYFGCLENVKLELLDDYPNSYGFIDQAGTLFLGNTSTGYYTVYHVSGSKVTFESNGDTMVQAAGNFSLQAAGTIDLVAGQGINLNSGSISIKSSGKLEVVGGGGSYEATSVSKIDGKAIGQYADTGVGATQQQFYAFAVAGNKLSANKVNPQIPPARN